MTSVIPAVKPAASIPLPDCPAPSVAAKGNSGTPIAVLPRHAKTGRDHPGIWLVTAAAGLLVLAGAAAAVSFSAQYRLVYAARHLAVVAGLEASIPDAAALVFACLGVALALHGRRAVRARVLNIASAGASVFMNVIAAAPGWRDLAVWAMPPAAYALASDTLIGVVRSWAIARDQDTGNLTQEVTVLAAAGGLALWLLRLSMAPASTLVGFRAWVVEECPVAPGRRPNRNNRPTQAVSPIPTGSSTPLTPPASSVLTAQSDISPLDATVGPRGSGPREGTKTARFLSLVTELHGPLAAIPLGSVANISAVVAPQADLNTGAARAALRRAVLAAQDGDRR